MIDVELFFDYAYPYCYRGHKNLLNLLEYYPRIEITWRSCKLRSYPETCFMHSNCMVQGTYYIQEHGENLWRCHRLVYKVCFNRSIDIASTDVFVELAKQYKVNHNAFRNYIGEDRYREQVLAGNRYAWGGSRLNVVPSYQFGKYLLGLRDDLLMPARELRDLLGKATVAHQTDGPVQWVIRSEGFFTHPFPNLLVIVSAHLLW